MQKLRKLNFFDRTQASGWFPSSSSARRSALNVNDGSRSSSTSLLSEIEAIAGSTNYLLLGTRGKELLVVERDFKRTTTVSHRTAGLAQDESILRLHECRPDVFLALVHGNGGERLRFFRVEGAQRKVTPVGVSIPVFDRKACRVTSCECLGDHCVVIGSDRGQLQLVYRPLEKSPAVRYVSVSSFPGAPDNHIQPAHNNSSTTFESQVVTGCHFLDQVRGANNNDKHIRVVLFVTTPSAVYSYSLGGLASGRLDPDHGVRLLNEDRAGGADPHCSAVFRSMQCLLVARKDGVFSYDADEGNLSAIPLDGRKHLLLCRGPFFVTVTSEGEYDATSRARVTVCLSYPHMRFIAYSSLFAASAETLRVVPGMQDSLFVLDGADQLFQLREKPKTEQIDVLLKKRMFDWAAILVKDVQQQEVGPASMCEIYRLHGDALFEKRMYEQALAVYMKSIDADLPLEASYVIEKYLEVSKISHIAKFLRKLHERPGLAEARHTELLIKCYTKNAAARGEDKSAQSSYEELEEFLAKVPVEHYDYKTALHVLETTPGFMPQAIMLAKKAKDGLGYVRMLLAGEDGYQALGFLKQKTLGIETRLGILLTHGATLMKKHPAEVHRLFLDLIKSPREAGREGLSEEELDEIMRVYCVNDESAESGEELSRVREAFLQEAAFKMVHLLPHKWVDAVLLPALLECLLRRWRKEQQCPKIAKEVLKLLEEHAMRRNFLERVPLLCGMYDFSRGLLFAYERLGEFQSLIAYHLDRGDVDGLLETCRRCGSREPRLWLQALTSLPQAAVGVENSRLAQERPSPPESTSSTLDDSLTRIRETAIPEILRNTDLPPLSGLRCLSQNKVPLKAARGYLKNALEKLRPSESKTTEDRVEIAKMEAEVESIKGKPRIFAAAKCYECGLNLEPPSVHFFCMHSYHAYCVGDECRKCSQNVGSIGAAGPRSTSEPNDEEFFKYLKSGRNLDGGFPVIADYFAQGVF
ncbi:unnamed protein product [Amoebophrya sp. A25]|nr:unnamed protein product [Amoebophrya sp. A25]|eukprot:GSA25T00022534001.1